jgi:chromosome partitioning protein
MSQLKECSICNTPFKVRFSYQVQRTANQTFFFCNQSCHEKYLFSDHLKTCSVCGAQFEMLYAYQQLHVNGVLRHYCSHVCRNQDIQLMEKQKKPAMRKIAVLNQKGGTGKTTTSVNVASGLAEAGKKTLIIDLDSQANVAVSLGLNAPKSITDVLVGMASPSEAIIQVTNKLDALISTASLSTAETELAQIKHNRHQILENVLKGITEYDYVILDCSPSLSVLNINTLSYADQILIPVSCDYLSLVGVRNILKTIAKVNEVLLHPIDILGVVPTFYGLSEKCTTDTMVRLNAHFKEKVLSPIHFDTNLRQAPMHRQSIFEYAPASQGAQDYRQLVQQIINTPMPAQKNFE